MPDHWIQPATAIVGAICAAAIWAFTLSSRVSVLERLFEQHLEEKQVALRDLSTHIQRVEEKIDRLNTRCLSYAANVHRLPPVEEADG